MGQINLLDQVEIQSYTWAQMGKVEMKWNKIQIIMPQKMSIWQALVRESAEDYKYVALELSWA